MKNQSILVYLACGLIAWSLGCSTNDTVTQDDNSWSVEEPPPVEGEQEPHTHPPILTDGSEPQDVNFVFHPLSQAKAPIRWIENREHVEAITRTGRALNLYALALNDHKSKWQSPADIPSDIKIWVGVRFPDEISYGDSHHVFECPDHNDRTTNNRTHLRNKVVYCSHNYPMLKVHILDQDDSHLRWFDSVTEGFLDAHRRGDTASYLENYVRAGKLPWWETSVFLQRDGGELEFQQLTRNNQFYFAFKDQYHEEYQLSIDASSVIE